MGGNVILVGAGPGGKDLLTLRGAQAITQAEVVIYDRLVSSDILDLIPFTAKKINVGKRNHHHPVPQQTINKLLVQYARQGKRVVRLKGGDCYLFGRGGEEGQFLFEHQIPFEVVPGVTSALAVPAFAGIPVTHRSHASSVHIITAHAQAGKELEIPFDALVRTKGTLVFLMGLTAVEQITKGLLENGMQSDMPAAVISNGARGNQKKVVGTIATLAKQVTQANLQSPALIVIGEVCTLHTQLDWFTKLPLHGKNIIVTRPQERIGTLAQKLRSLGANVFECPCIEIVEREDTALLNFQLIEENWDWVVLTSPSGVKAMIHAIRRTGFDLRILYGTRFAVLGAATAKALEEYGIVADVMPDIYDSKHLAQTLLKVVQPQEKVLLLRAAQGTEEIPRALKQAHIFFSDVPTYDIRYQTRYAKELHKQLESNEIDVVTFTSASTVRGFVEAVGQKTGFVALCIGIQTAQQAKQFGMNVKVAKEATIDSMIDCLLEDSNV